MNLAGKNYKLISFQQGKIFLKLLDSPAVNPREFQDLRYLALKEGKLVHLPNHPGPPFAFNDVMTIPSGIMTDSLARLSSRDYRDYLQNLKIAKAQLKADMLIFNLETDFNEFKILVPQYEGLQTRLKAIPESRNVDDYEIIEYKVPIPEVSAKKGSTEALDKKQ